MNGSGRAPVFLCLESQSVSFYSQILKIALLDLELQIHEDRIYTTNTNSLLYPYAFSFYRKRFLFK